MKIGDFIIIFIVLGLAVIAFLSFSSVAGDLTQDNGNTIITDIFEDNEGHYALVKDEKVYLDKVDGEYYIDDFGRKFFTDDIVVLSDAIGDYHIYDDEKYYVLKFDTTYYYDSEGNEYSSDEVNDYIVEVTYDGKVLYKFYLTDITNRHIVIDEKGHNELIVKDGYVDMIHADCPDQNCVYMEPITYDSWYPHIICAPNKIVVSVYGGDHERLDDIV